MLDIFSLLQCLMLLECHGDGRAMVTERVGMKKSIPQKRVLLIVHSRVPLKEMSRLVLPSTLAWNVFAVIAVACFGLYTNNFVIVRFEQQTANPTAPSLCCKVCFMYCRGLHDDTGLRTQPSHAQQDVDASYQLAVHLPMGVLKYGIRNRVV